MMINIKCWCWWSVVMVNWHLSATIPYTKQSGRPKQYYTNVSKQAVQVEFATRCIKCNFCIDDPSVLGVRHDEIATTFEATAEKIRVGHLPRGFFQEPSFEKEWEMPLALVEQVSFLLLFCRLSFARLVPPRWPLGSLGTHSWLPQHCTLSHTRKALQMCGNEMKKRRNWLWN